MGLFAQIKKGEKRMLQNTSAGLSEAEAKARLAKVGENRLRGKKGASVAAMFFSQFKDLMILILAAATLISVLMGEGTEAITIIIIVLMNATMGFLQEYRTEKTLEALKELSAPTARVRRSGRELEVGARTVVPATCCFSRPAIRWRRTARCKPVCRYRATRPCSRARAFPPQSSPETDCTWAAS